jgi:hypothetical protein
MSKPEHLQHFLRSKVVLRLGSSSSTPLLWSRSRLPTLADVEPIHNAIREAGLNPHMLLLDESPSTPFENGDGNWSGLAAELGPPVHKSCESQRADAFRRFIKPSLDGARSTRHKHWLYWRGILTWGIARHCLDRLLPMPVQTFESLIWDLLSLDSSYSSTKAYIDCIQARHRRFKLTSPVTSDYTYNRLARGLQRFQGRQRKFVYPVHKTMVASLLRHPTTSWVVWRNCLAAALTTLCCLRPSEGAALQSCDVFFDFDVASNRPGYEGTAAINIVSRKNDQIRRGHQPRLGKSQSCMHDLVHQLHLFMVTAGTEPRHGCSKLAAPQARCPLCPPLFPHLMRLDGNLRFSTRRPSPSTFSSWIVAALGSIGVNTSAFAGVSARRGGLSTAIEAGVPEVILWMQSGHAQSPAARHYITLNSPELLYRTWEAFHL